MNAKDTVTADAKRASFSEKLVRLENIIGTGPYFAGTKFSLADAVFTSIFRYFDVLGPDVSAPIFDGLSQVSAWRSALGVRSSVASAVRADYGARFQDHLKFHEGLLTA